MRPAIDGTLSVSFEPAPSPKLVINMGSAGREWQEFYSAMRFAALLEGNTRLLVQQEQQYARSLAGCFHSSQRRMVALSSEIAAEGRLGT